MGFERQNPITGVFSLRIEMILVDFFGILHRLGVWWKFRSDLHGVICPAVLWGGGWFPKPTTSQSKTQITNMASIKKNTKNIHVFVKSPFLFVKSPFLLVKFPFIPYLPKHSWCCCACCARRPWRSDACGGKTCVAAGAGSATCGRGGHSESSESADRERSIQVDVGCLSCNICIIAW